METKVREDIGITPAVEILDLGGRQRALQTARALVGAGRRAKPIKRPDAGVGKIGERRRRPGGFQRNEGPDRRRLKRAAVKGAPCRRKGPYGRDEFLLVGARRQRERRFQVA
jgi:hypothetical protein